MSRQIPGLFNAGDTLEFTAGFSDVNADYTPGNGYTLEYFVRGECNFTAAGVANGDNSGWVVTFAPADTENAPGGLYTYIARVKKDGNVFTVDQGKITVKPNLENAEADTQVDHVQRMIAAIEDALEGRVTDDTQQMSVAGRSIVHIPVLELESLLNTYKRKLIRLQRGPNRRLNTMKVIFDERV